MANNKLIQGFFRLKRVEITEEVKAQLSELKKNYLIEWSVIGSLNGDDLYLGVMRDASRIEDSTDEEGNVIPGLLSAISLRNPVIIGVWNMDGTEFGTIKQVTPAEYNENGEIITEEVVTITGEPVYPFNKDVYQSLIQPRIQTDEDGNEISRETFYDIRSFSGFKPKINF